VASQTDDHDRGQHPKRGCGLDHRQA
jgi:hypothetical protein